MQRNLIEKPTRKSKGHFARMRKAAGHAAAIGVALPLIASAAMAECQRPTSGSSVFDQIPLASGTAVSSIIATISSVNASSLAQSTALVSTPPNPMADQQGGGNWSRVIAGEVETKNNTSITATSPITGSAECRSTTKLDFIGTQAGMDIGKYNFAGGGNIHWGFTTGYFDADAKDKTLGTFSSDNNVAFAGLYLAMSSGNLSFDAQVRGDFYHMELSDADQSLYRQPITARGIAFLWNLAYRFDLPNNWFIEPSIGGVSSRTEVGRIDTAGSFFGAPSFVNPGSVQIDDINSLLGRASVRIGTTFTNGNIAWQPFATASVFHEFAGSVRTDMQTNSFLSGAPNVAATSFTSREGTYGHIGLGLAGVILDSGWLGYVRGDYRFGDNIEGLSVNAGLRYQFTPAKDIVAGLKDGGDAGGYRGAYNWTGFHAGWNTGSVWGHQEWTFLDVDTTTTPKYQGYALGGEIGYDYQMGPLVLGIAADYAWSNAEGGMSCPNAQSFSCVAKIDSIGFLTGRLGVARDRALYYVRGGLAMAEVGARGKYNLDGAGLSSGLDLADTTKTLTGWALGAGMEFAVTDRWSVKGEWMHYDLGSTSFVLDDNPSDNNNKIGTTGEIARIGVNYHFGHRGTDYSHDPMK